MFRAWKLLLLGAVLGAPSAARAEGEVELVRAAPLRGDAEWPPRRLFNAGLDAEERGNKTLAVQLYMSARLAARGSVADQLYARGAGLRLVRILAGYDDDAAAAAAMLVDREASGDRATTDLAPLIRTLLRRVERAEGGELSILTGTIASIRVLPSGQASIELEAAGAERTMILAEGPVGPFSAGDPVRAVVRKESSRAAASWRLIGMGLAGADGWQLLAVAGLPGEPGPAYGALMGKR